MSTHENPQEQLPVRNPEKNGESSDAETDPAITDDALEALAVSAIAAPNAKDTIIDAEVVDPPAEEANVVEQASIVNEASGIEEASVVENDTRDEIVEAELVEEDAAEENSAEENSAEENSVGNVQSPDGFNRKKMQRKGGAVGGALLGLLSIVGAWLTIYSLINAALGMAFSIWGLGSDSRKVAAAGIVLSVIGAALSLILGR